MAFSVYLNTTLASDSQAYVDMSYLKSINNEPIRLTKITIETKAGGIIGNYYTAYLLAYSTGQLIAVPYNYGGTATWSQSKKYEGVRGYLETLLDPVDFTFSSRMDINLGSGTSSLYKIGPQIEVYIAANSANVVLEPPTNMVINKTTLGESVTLSWHKPWNIVTVIEVYNSANTLIYTFNNGLNTHTFPADFFKSGTYTIKLKNRLLGDYFTLYSAVAESSYTFTVPPVTSFSLNRNDVSSDITLSYSATAGYNTSIQVYQGGSLLHQWYSSTGSYLVPKNTLPVGDITFRLANISGSELSSVNEQTFNLVNMQPTVSNLLPNNTSQDINQAFNVSWDSTNQSVYKLTIDDKVFNGTTSKVLTIPANTIRSGIKTMTLEVTYQGAGYTNTVSQTVTFTATDYVPTITALEPSNVDQNINLPIIISWTSTYQHQFKLVIDGKTYTGTTEKSLTLPANTLTSGIKTMSLDVIYIPVLATSPTDYRTVTITATFSGFGNPPKPTLLNKAIISTATPTIKWDSTEQTAYELKILDGMSNVVATGEKLSTAKFYAVTVVLENNKLYTIKLRVKNQYNLWSEYATSTFTTSFVVPNTPIITGFSDVTNGSIILNVATETSEEYKNSEIWRKELYGEWVRMAYNLAEVDTWVDNYVRSGISYEYKARSIGQTGGVAESDAISLSTTVKGYNFYNLENLGSNIIFKYDAEVIPTYNRNEALTMYAGCSAPGYETDNVIYQVLNMSFAFKTPSDIDKFINLIKTTRVFLYKDLKGRKVFGMITGNFSPKTDNQNITNISFVFTELSFLEQNVYAGDNTGLKLLQWDGTWAFEGAYAFGGA